MIKLTGVDGYHPVAIKSIHEVEDKTKVHFHPANILGTAAVAGQNSDMHAFLGLPGEGRATLHGALETANNRHDWQQNVILCNDKVMHHR